MSQIYFASSGDASVIPIYPIAPSSPVEGQEYINSSDNGWYVYYGGTWNLVFTFGAPVSSYILFENSDRMLMENGDLAVLG